MSEKLIRRLRRLLWAAVWVVTDINVKALLLFSRLLAIIPGFLRKYLAAPLQKISSHALAKSNGLPLPDRHTITKMDVETLTNDGVVLNGTLYLPVEPDHNAHDHSRRLESHHKFPTIITRTPYGRHNLGPLWAQIFAERGYAVLLQDTRGRFGSSGDFFPVKDEIVDGGATIEWIREQPWSNGKIALYGVSYLGLTTYAAAGSSAGKHVDAIVPVMCTAKTYNILYHSKSGALALDLVLRWLWLAVKLLNSVHIYKFWIPGLQGELNSAFMDTPLRDQDEKLIGSRLEFLQDAIRATSLDHEFWSDKNVLCDMSNQDRPPTHIVGGWYDFFIKGTFEDFEEAKKVSSKPCKLTVGRWKHWEFSGFTGYGSPSIKLALNFFDRYLKTEEYENSTSLGEDDGHPIHVAFLGTNPTRWGGFDKWPPEVSNTVPFALNNTEKKTSHNKGSFSQYRYDPAAPTPYVGGPSFDIFNSGRIEQSSLEMRDDVLVFTSAKLTEAMYICGNVAVDLHAESTNPFTDFFFKLCDIPTSETKSYNIIEGIHRLDVEDWMGSYVDEQGTKWYTIRKSFQIAPIAQCYKTGHKWRLQISGGAHPLYMRNFGTGHDIADAVELRPAVHRIFHDSNVLFPIIVKRDIDRCTKNHPAYPEHEVEHFHP